MDLHTLNQHRTTLHTRAGDISAIDLGEGRVSLFIHGLGTNALLWRNVIGQLQHEQRCVAIDLPLHGQTPARRDQDVSLAALADLIEDVCDAIAAPAVDLVANDTGGAIAQIFAARHPERLATLTLTNCETHDNVPPPALKLSVRLARLGLLGAFTRLVARWPRLARTVIFGSGYERPERLSTEVVRAYLDPIAGTRETARQFNRWIASLNPRDLLAVEPELQRLTVPTLVVWGTGDRFFARHWAYWLRDTIPGVTEVVELAGARLFFPDERAGELVVQLRRHWEAHSAASGAGHTGSPRLIARPSRSA